jgi:hypothetical protein
MVVFEKMFRESGGKPVEYQGKIIQLGDEVSVGKAARVKIVFEKTNSQWRQGVALRASGTFEIAGQKIKRGLALWQDTAPQETEFVVHSLSGTLDVRNIWDVGDGITESGHNGAAMIVEEIPNGRRYYCNDGKPDDDFDDIIFRLEWAE